jgi:putative membrane protein
VDILLPYFQIVREWTRMHTNKTDKLAHNSYDFCLVYHHYSYSFRLPFVLFVRFVVEFGIAEAAGRPIDTISKKREYTNDKVAHRWRLREKKGKKGGKMISAIQLFAIGIVLGIGNVIPGVSGGTLAVVFDVYDRLISVITFNVKKILSAWKFWLPLLVGAIAGIIVFSKLVSFLFVTYPAPTKCFFIGIILGSIPLILNKAKKPGAAFMPVSGALCAIAALLIMLAMIFLKPEGSGADFSEINFLTVLFFFAAGIIAAVAMIIPGISGSFLLLALGVYFIIIDSISQLTNPLSGFIRGNHDIIALLSALKTPVLILMPFGIGVIAGLLAGAALVRLLMEKAPYQTYSAILGLIAGSVLVIYPRGDLTNTITVIISIVSLIFGAGISLCFSRKEAGDSKKSKKSKNKESKK